MKTCCNSENGIKMDLTLSLENDRPIDVITVGRAGVDFYALQEETELEAVEKFEKRVGGTPANIAVALARLGSKSAILSKVSKDSFGTFVRHYLSENNVDTRFVQTDAHGKLNSLAFTEIKKHGCKVLFYREDPADLNLGIQDISGDIFNQCKIMVVSGTALASSPSREAVLYALDCAARENTLIISDLDYRESSWSSKEEASLYLNLLAEKSQVLVGNDDEFEVLEALYTKNSLEGLRKRLRLGGVLDLILFKQGSKGSIAMWGESETLKIPPYPSDLKKPFGAGDAYLAGFIHYYLKTKNLEVSLHAGSAAAAMVVSRRGCSHSMPSSHDIDRLLEDSRLLHSQTNQVCRKVISTEMERS